SAAYGLVSYQTARLKAHYPAPFMAAALSADMHNTDKVVTLIEECRSMKLRIQAPDVNLPEDKFTVDDSGSVVYGLGAIKGARVDRRRLSERVWEPRIRPGALASVGPLVRTEQQAYLQQVHRSRAALAAAMEEAIAAAGQRHRTADSGHDDLFGDLRGPAAE